MILQNLILNTQVNFWKHGFGWRHLFYFFDHLIHVEFFYEFCGTYLFFVYSWVFVGVGVGMHQDLSSGLLVLWSKILVGFLIFLMFLIVVLIFLMFLIGSLVWFLVHVMHRFLATVLLVPPLYPLVFLAYVPPYSTRAAHRIGHPTHVF